MTSAQLVVDPDRTVSPVDRRVSGSFVEHLGRAVHLTRPGVSRIAETVAVCLDGAVPGVTGLPAPASVRAVVGPVVSRAWWQAHAGQVVLADVRRDVLGVTASSAYADGHLPGAVLVDLERVLSGPASPEHGRHPLPSPEVFAEGMARAGIGDADVVVAYDDAAGVVAARLVWMLRVTGHEAALLDGGMRPDDPRETAPTEPGRRTFTPCPWPGAALADLHDVGSPGSVVLDARSAARFAGAPDALDPRPGHLPGARSLPCLEMVDDDGFLLPDEVLRERLAQAGVDGSAPVISSCGSGVTACHTLLLMEHLGLPAGRLYPGSWSQWAADPRRPVELGPRR